MIPKERKASGNLFIALEGLSSSGKTTIGKILAERIRGTFYKTPPPLFDQFRDEIDRKAVLEARFFFYLAGVIQASKDISVILEAQSVVCDRYLMTTLCFHRAVGIEIDVPDSVFDLLLKPDFTFLIMCDDPKRLSRLYKRGLSYNDVAEQGLRIEQKFLSEYRKHVLTEIDNSNDDPSIAVDTIQRIIQMG